MDVIALVSWSGRMTNLNGIGVLNESHSIYVDNTKVLRYAIVDTTICITVDT